MAADEYTYHIYARNQKALLALLSHGIDGNDVEAMRAAKAELQEYLIERN